MVCDICSFVQWAVPESPLYVWSGQDTWVSTGSVGGGGGWTACGLTKPESLEQPRCKLEGPELGNRHALGLKVSSASLQLCDHGHKTSPCRDLISLFIKGGR